MTWESVAVKSFKETMRWEPEMPEFIEAWISLYQGSYFWQVQMSGGLRKSYARTTTLEAAQKAAHRSVVDIVDYIKEELKC